jgi:hypothetical protein
MQSAPCFPFQATHPSPMRMPLIAWRGKQAAVNKVGKRRVMMESCFPQFVQAVQKRPWAFPAGKQPIYLTLQSHPPLLDLSLPSHHNSLLLCISCSEQQPPSHLVNTLLLSFFNISSSGSVPVPSIKKCSKWACLPVGSSSGESVSLHHQRNTT